jgi:hypothetical protein
MTSGPVWREPPKAQDLAVWRWGALSRPDSRAEIHTSMQIHTRTGRTNCTRTGLLYILLYTRSPNPGAA